MPLATDARFGPYRIVSMLGAGGMGEVYRARDTRLERDVALKVMTAAASGDAERRARFEREARAVAALNHPNIVAVYDVGEQDGALYIVTELVEGESLRRRIERGMIGARELLSIAVQMADGISAAHQAGIVHRDLKPENVMLTPEGRVKILDFGLARHTAAAAAPDHTVTINSTVPGAIMGTVNYMSPEQARGAEATYRSDQFSFGIILYEMASGAQAFVRDTTPQTLTAILVEEPKPLDAKVPAPLRWTVQRCLAKEAGQRYESTRDLYHDLKNQQEHISELSSASVIGAAAPEIAAAAPKRSAGKAIAAAAAVGIVAGALVMFWLAPKRPGSASFRYTPIEIERDVWQSALWSPDGKAAAYAARVDGTLQVFVRFLDSPVASQLTHDPRGAVAAGWAPDSKRIFISARNTQGDSPAMALFSLSVTGGEPEFVMPLDLLRAGPPLVSVSPNGKMLVGVKQLDDATNCVVTSSPIGAPWQRYAPAPFESKTLYNVPRVFFSPDGSKILYMVNNGREEAWLLPFPPGKGTPKKVLEKLPGGSRTPSFSWFPDSRHTLVSTYESFGERHLWVADTVRDASEKLTGGISDEPYASVSPDGRRILVTQATAHYRIVSASLTDASVRTVVEAQRLVGMPMWSAKSDRFVYVTEANGEPEIWLRESDGSERPMVTPAVFPPGVNYLFNAALSPTGDRVAYTMITEATEARIWISAAAGGPPVRLTSGKGTEYMSAWSPDGGRVVFLQNVDGLMNLEIARTSGQTTALELRHNISGTLPDWSPDGQWITYRDSSGWNLISPDGKTTRALGKINSVQLTFSKDSQSVYGIRQESGHVYLFSQAIATGQMKTIGDVGSEFAPSSPLGPAIRFSVSPAGDSILYSTSSGKNSLWMLEGFGKP